MNRACRDSSTVLVQPLKLLVLFAFVLVGLTTSVFAQDTGGDKGVTAEYFASLRDDPAKHGTLRQLLTAFPKGGELHSHLSGAVPFDRLMSVARNHNYWIVLSSGDLFHYFFLPSRNPDFENRCGLSSFHQDYLQCVDVDKLTTEQIRSIQSSMTLPAGIMQPAVFDEFQKRFERLDNLTDNTDVIPDLVAELMGFLSGHKVTYVELKLNPLGRSDSNGKDTYIEDLLDAIRDEVDRVNQNLDPPVMVKLIVSLLRGDPLRPGGITEHLGPIECRPGTTCPPRLRQAYYLAAGSQYSDMVVGIDLHGLPEIEVGSANRRGPALDHPFSVHIALLAAEFGVLPTTFHAGESWAPSHLGHIVEAIEAGAVRIGHGLNLIGNPAAEALVCRRRLAIETSLTSNRLLGFVSDLSKHPAREIIRPTRWCQHGQAPPVTLNTDDAGIFNTNMSNEFFLAVVHFSLEWDEVKQLARNSIVRALASGSERLQLLTAWETAVADFEANWVRP